MSEIKWKESAVCYADGEQWFCGDDAGRLIALTPNGVITSDASEINHLCDFQLNEPQEGYCIPKSELDTEEKYNKAVKVFWLFGYDQVAGEGFSNFESPLGNLAVSNGGLFQWGSRIKDPVKVTFNQLMAIGELKREMIKREKSAPKTAPDLTPDIGRKTAVEYLQGCINVQKERGEQFNSSGEGERSFDAAAKAFNALTGRDLKGSDVCLLFACVKAVRQYSNPNRLHEDSLLDGVSYLSLWAEELNKELK